MGLVLSGIQYYLFHNGLMATGPFDVGAFVRTSNNLDCPDAQLYMNAATFHQSANTGGSTYAATIEKAPGMIIYGMFLHLTSEGSVEISGREPDAPLNIKPNWLSTPEDKTAIIDLIRLIRRWLEQPAIAPFIEQELAPGGNITNDEELLAWAHANLHSGLHGVGTCRMGSDPDSVVDERLRVRGVEGLRVADCSVMPGLISGNTNGPAMALGRRAANIIMEDARA